MAEYYTMGNEYLGKPDHIAGSNPSTEKATIMGAEFKHHLQGRYDIINSLGGLGGIPEDALILILKYSLEKYPKPAIFKRDNGAAIMKGMHAGQPNGLEGKIVEALLQCGNLVGIKTPNGR